MGTLGAILSITIIDLALSGDNAAVIGLAIRNLPGPQRRLAAVLGAGGAILFRIALTALATVLLRVPYLNAAGGLVLIWVTWKLLAESQGEGESVSAGATFWSAIGTIVAADVSMSFDNVMGVAGAAQGSIALMAFGLLASIPILIAGSSLLATLMNRYPLLIYIGGAVLAHTAINMFFHDAGLHLIRLTGATAAALIPWGVALAVFLWGWLQVRRPVTRQEAGEVAKDLNAFETTLEQVATGKQDAPGSKQDS
ncbi:MAG: TerC family protein [Symbiobacteriia bacterium]